MFLFVVDSVLSFIIMTPELFWREPSNWDTRVIEEGCCRVADDWNLPLSLPIRSALRGSAPLTSLEAKQIVSWTPKRLCCQSLHDAQSRVLGSVRHPDGLGEAVAAHQRRVPDQLEHAIGDLGRAHLSGSPALAPQSRAASRALAISTRSTNELSRVRAQHSPKTPLQIHQRGGMLTGASLQIR